LIKKLKPTEFEKQIKKELDINPDLIVLAGFMTILSKDICCMFGNKIINTHPSLLPKYGGKGMYGVKVQESVMKNKEVYAGCSTHFVTSEIDAGEIIFQEKLKIDYSLTPWELGGKIFDLEGDLLIKTIQNIMFK
jgi:phosphoribosylglycinamide formyltransferase-1